MTMVTGFNKKYFRTALFLAVTLFAAAVQNSSYAATKKIQDSVSVDLPFIADSLCFINDSTGSLARFYEGLELLLEGRDTIINIIHIGDSHIQAGFLTGTAMRLFQNTFGNAGRGWVSPLKLSGTNEPDDYYITSGVKKFIAGTCIQNTPKCCWGLGGVGIETSAAHTDLGILIAPKNGVGYDFDKALLYRDKSSKQLFPDSDMDFCYGASVFEDILVDTFISPQHINCLYVKSYEEDTFPDPSVYYGFSLTNGHSGILYHALGVNGAKFTDFTSRKYIRQLSLLNPALIIVSLGTNESFGRNFNKPEFERQVSAFVSLISEELPNVSIVLTTPVETYKRTRRQQKKYYVRNENTEKAAEVISSYTANNGLACWNLFTASGGANSCKRWFDAKMFAYDRVHFTRKGYGEQGKLLYKALINNFNNVEKWKKEERNVE